MLHFYIGRTDLTRCICVFIPSEGGHCSVVRCHPVKEESSSWWAGSLLNKETEAAALYKAQNLDSRLLIPIPSFGTESLCDIWQVTYVWNTSVYLYEMGILSAKLQEIVWLK